VGLPGARDIRAALERRWAHEARVVDVDDPAATGPAPQLQTDPTIDDRELPVDANSLRAVREWLAGIVPGDADLVIGAALYGFDLHELADELGIGHEAARKRFQRAIRRIRERPLESR
jgi:DNA-directed RNA polymerase specialized sigma24 family protein